MSVRRARATELIALRRLPVVRGRRALVLTVVMAALLAACVPPLQWHGRDVVVLSRSGRDVVRTLRVHETGEVLARITAAAPGVSWRSTTSTSAVIRVSVDGRYVTDDVVTDASPLT